MSSVLGLRLAPLGFCLAALAGCLAFPGLVPAAPPPNFTWLCGAALIFAGVSCLTLTCQNLPLQNLLAICVIISVMACIENRIPGSTTPRASDLWSLSMLFISWITIVLTSRFMARLILSSRRGIGAYGIWVWLLAALLSTHLNIGVTTLTSAATGTENPGLPGFFHALRLALTAAAMLVCISPWLIPKRPTPLVESREPVVLWLGANLLCASAAIHFHDWLQTAVILSVAALAATFTLRPISRPAPGPSP